MPLSRTLVTLCTSRPHILAKCLAEMLGCTMFHFLGSLSPTPVANSMALISAVYYSAKVSGAHLNPAVTGTFCLLGFTHPFEAMFYIASQIAGCVFGALLLALVVPGCSVGDVPAPGVLAGCFVPSPGVSDARVVAWECIGTVMFIVVVQSVVWYTQNKPGYGQTGPIMVGLALYASALAVGPWTGAAFNPARVLGSAIVYGCARNATTAAYIAGHALATVLVPLFIIPWYGIAVQSWFLAYLPAKLRDHLKSYLPSIELKTLDNIQ